MRIISQDGCYDVPYERVILQRYKCKIYILSKDLAGVEKIVSDPVVAEYSSEGKAIKAMEMCQKEYMRYIKYDRTHATSATIFDNPKVFRFPKEGDFI